MSFLQLLLINLAVVFVAMTLMWLISLAKRDASIVDPFWGAGFAVIGWSTLLILRQTAFTGWLILALVTLWSLRLSSYLLWRNLGEGEDRRYREMRDKHGYKFWRVSFVTVFMLQGAVMWVVSIAIQAGMFYAGAAPTFALLIPGICLWALGIFFESVGDWQLTRFKSQPENEGKVMDQGLWRYTRHPNYFGDFCVWWGLYLIAASVGCWWTVFSPLVMTFLLLKVSGVAHLEKDIADRREGYREYVDRTNAFFPGIPGD